MRNLKVVLSVLFVLLVGFLVIRGCVRTAPTPRYEEGTVQRPARPETPRPSQLALAPLVPVPGVLPPAARPRVAIILDDWGYNLSLVKDVVAIGRPVTLSILPGLPRSTRIAEEAHKHGLGVMLHMPMQPKSSKEPLEPHTIMTGSSESEIRQYLDEALRSVPHAEGSNNHMGSAATSDPRVMRIFLSGLKSRGLFFVDSNVIPTTQGPRLAKELGVPFTQRDVFIDNKISQAAIVKQLKAAGRMALIKRRVVVIGHDHLTTVKAIASMVPVFEKAGIELVLVRDLVEKT
ncbi:MAG: divergent polysaccharide deacetylase family protein [Candidatus Omnitrophica bacterium]|nr:divergent polysaccharide deacetylase family protein [Candidatus Omnitrophota bacterium]